MNGVSIAKAIFTALFFAAPLSAQAAWGNMELPLSLESFASFKVSLANSSMSLVVFDAGQDSWRGAFEKLAATDRLAELPLVFRTAGAGAAVELYEREGWVPGPRWALMDWNADVHASGDAIPGLEALIEAFNNSGARTSVQRLREFVALNPDGAEARKALVAKLAHIANRRTAVALGLKKETRIDPNEPQISMGDETGFEFSNVPPEDEYAVAPGEAKSDDQRDGVIRGEYLVELYKPPVAAGEALLDNMLGDGQDDAIWGEYLAELSKLLANDGWAALSAKDRYRAPEAVSLVPPLARHSPVCQAALAKHLPAVEAVLKKLPGHGAAWQTWIGITEGSGRDIFKTSDRLLSEMEPLPWTAFDWPPPQLQQALLKRAMVDKDWSRVVKYGAERWDTVLTILLAEEKYTKNKPPFVPPLMNEHLWRSLAAALLEAHLATGYPKRAEDMMDYWKLCDGWAGAYGLAAMTAEKYMYLELARTWRQ
jgi:hypothetical protein